MGVAVLEVTKGLPRLLDCYVVATTKTRNRARRVVDDDVDRMNVLWLNIDQSIRDFKPDIIGVETYTVFKPGQGGHGKGAGWKALYAYVITATVGFMYKLPVYAFRPSDMKRRIANNTRASKVDVESAVRRQVQNLDEFLQTLPPGKHEHAADAVGHALCALERHGR